jgi:hypothetical protein
MGEIAKNALNLVFLVAAGSRSELSLLPIFITIFQYLIA